MFSWQRTAGVIIGLALGCALLALTRSTSRRTVPSGPILSESDGRIRELVIQYEPGAKEIAATVYREFLSALASDVTVHAVCPDRLAFDELKNLVGKVECRLDPIVVQHPITTWSRDRWVALQPSPTGDARTTLLSPRGEAAEEIWPARAGDERVGEDIAHALPSVVRARRSEFYFDAGDFLADKQNVFVVPRVLQRNIQRTVESREEFLEALASVFKRRLILLDEAPDHHAGMFMASVGDNTLLVGDPGLARQLIPKESCEDGRTATNGFMDLPGGLDFTPASQHLFDAVAEQCTAEGYKVVRIPVVPAHDGRTYLTYVNVLMERRGEQRIVYLPIYRGAEALNVAAREVWKGLGFEVRPVDCTATYRHFGCLHCLVNVLKRK